MFVLLVVYVRMSTVSQIIKKRQAHCILDLPNDKYRMEIEKELK